MKWRLWDAIVFLLGIVMVPSATAQPVATQSLTFPTLPVNLRTANDLVPSGWQINGQAEGDLNGDGLSDKVLVLLRVGRPTEGDNQMIVVAMARSGGGYELALQNHALFYRPADPDFFFAVTPNIVHGTLRLKTECGCGPGGDGTERFTFRWQRDHFNLIGYDYFGAARGSTLDASINYLTGVAQIGDGHVTRADERDTSYRSGTFHFTPKKLLAFDEIGDRGITFLVHQLCPIGVKRFCY
jgi:hypothetical protein